MSGQTRRSRGRSSSSSQVGVAAPVVIYFVRGDKASEILADLKSWMARHNAAIMAVILVIIGVKLIGDAISGFSV